MQGPRGYVYNMIESEISSRLSSPAIEPLPGPAGKIDDISSHREWFAKYAAFERSLCERDPSPMDLKLRHTGLVTEAAEAVIRAEDFPPPMARACLLAALYHDLGRFEQYRLFGTFRDRDSVNHGELSAYLVEKLGLLQKEPFVARAVTEAVRLHNCYMLPDELPSDVRITARLVRDADKLDILRVMDEELSGLGPCSQAVVLSQPDDPARVSQKVVDCALHGKVASYDDLTSVNDFRLLLGTWIYGMNFDSSRRLFAASGHGRRLVEALPAEGPYAEARAAVLKSIAAAG